MYPMCGNASGLQPEGPLLYIYCISMIYLLIRLSLTETFADDTAVLASQSDSKMDLPDTAK